MQADQPPGAAAGRRPDRVVEADFVDQIISFIARALPFWRDDPDRPPRDVERHLNHQLATWLNEQSRFCFNVIQFISETPDEVRSSRALDLSAQPVGVHIVLNGRRYSPYEVLLPIECKRLPTPRASDRDEREYVTTHPGSTGGIYRFKTGRHGAGHTRALMVGYLQEGTAADWCARINGWIAALAAAANRLTAIDALLAPEKLNWSLDDQLEPFADEPVHWYRSCHHRVDDWGHSYPPIALDHLWVSSQRT